MFTWYKQKRARDGASKFLATPIRKLMTPYVVKIKATASVTQVATRMIAHHVSCMVVVSSEDSQKPIGIVTERDFLRKVPASSTVLQKKVEDIMTTKLVTIDPETTVGAAHDVMRTHGFRKLIVVENDHLVGILTQTDIVQHALKTMKLFVSSRSFVKDSMTKKIVSVKKNASFAEAKKTMIKNDIGALLLKGKSYEGIFTEYDVVTQFYDQGGILQIKSPKDISHTHIRCVDASSSLLFASRVLLEKKMRRLLVLEKGEPVGIITQTDIAHALVEGARELNDEKFLKAQEKFFSLSKQAIDSSYVNENFRIYE